MPDVYVSYSSMDKDIADNVVSYLEERGITCWYAPRDIPPGSYWETSISTAISSCKVFLLIYGQNSSQSDQVARELGNAESLQHVSVIPYRIDETPLTGAFRYYLASSHWVSTDQKKKNNNYEELYNNIIAIKGSNEQNITNDTYIDNLYVHGTENESDAVNSVTENNKTASPVQQPKSKKRLIIGIASSVAVIAAVLIIAVAALVIKGGESSENTANYVTVDGFECNGSFTGESENGIYNGRGVFEGTYIYDEAIHIKYTGNFSNNVPDDSNCEVIITYPSGKIYEKIVYKGSIIAGVRSGHGVQTAYYSSDQELLKKVYDGNYSNDLGNGNAKLTSIYRNGDVAESTGNFVDGYLNDTTGNATWYREYKTGDYIRREYKGGYKNGNWDGQGTIKNIYRNGDVEEYSGNYVDGKLNDTTGNATWYCLYKTGDIAVKQYKGCFNNGKLNGQGTLTSYFRDGQNAVFKGTFTDNYGSSGTTTYYDTNGNITKTETIG